MALAIHRAAASDDTLDHVVDALAEAFSGDPPMQWFLPDSTSRFTRLQRYFRGVLPFYMANGEVWVSDDPAGAAVWVAPGNWPFSRADQLRALRPELSVFGRHPRLALAGLRAIERGHPEKPHWYLDYIGVAAGARGRGTGGALLAPILERCDAERMPAYLNAGSPNSRRLYERHGFVSTAEFRLPFDGPPLWRMWREPLA
jgi:GNAT superfamily N-acetyltransferase